MAFVDRVRLARRQVQFACIARRVVGVRGRAGMLALVVAGAVASQIAVPHAHAQVGAAGARPSASPSAPAASALPAATAPSASAPPAAPGAEPPLPTRTPAAAGITQVFVAGGARSLLKIALPLLGGDAELARSANDVNGRDLMLASMFQVLDPQSFTASAKEGLGLDVAAWRGVGAEAVVKGVATKQGANVHLEYRLYSLARGTEAVLRRDYDVPANQLRGAAHKFGNEVVKWFTGQPGTFGTRLVYSATTGKGQKGLFLIESDGYGPTPLAVTGTTALAPALGPGGVYYAGGQADGTYSLFRVGQAEPAFRSTGLVFGAAFAGEQMAVVISAAGQSDIFVGGLSGVGLGKVTRGGINTHPSFGPGGKLTYVSNAGGSPQIYVDGRRVSFQGSYNMAPVWCNDPEGARVLFMGRDGSNWDVFSVAPDGTNMRRLTQDQGSNTYPACSPDGRTVAFFSSRGGLFLANSQGQNQQKIASVQGESLRWETN